MNTLEISRSLIRSGMIPKTAEEQALILYDITKGLATKSDIERLEQLIDELKQSAKVDNQRLEQLIDELKQSAKVDNQRLEQSIDKLEKKIGEMNADIKLFIKWLIGSIITIGTLIIAAIKLFEIFAK